ncbi:MAG TPA: glycosyltransferase [Candidatus Lokiarchaeia archaeon]
MIVKNESIVIERCLESIKNVVDSFVIVDTGSSDNTIEIIQKWGQKNKIPGNVYSSSWISFGANRTEALKLAQNKSDYLLLLDADIVAVLGNFQKQNLNADAYYIRYTGSNDYAQMLLVKNQDGLHYVGVTREYLAGNFKTVETLNTIQILHYCDGNNQQDKFLRDIKLLTQGIIDEPTNSRYYFYLANSYRDLENYEKAIEYYLKRVDMGGWAEEVYYAAYQLGLCHEKLNRVNAAKYYYLSAWEYRPTIAESLYCLANLCRRRKEYRQAYMFVNEALKITYPKDLLFICKPIYVTLLKQEKQIIENQLFKKPYEFNRADALENLKDIYEVCNKLKISIFPFAGSLLGIIRENDFIKHDLDMDFGIKRKDFSMQIVQELEKAGFKYSRQFGSLDNKLELRFFKRNIQIDFFVFYEKLDYECTYCSDSHNYYEVRYKKFNLIDYNFKNITIKVPQNPEDFIKQQYGEDWKTPKPNYDYIKDAKNMRLEQK